MTDLPFTVTSGRGASWAASPTARPRPWWDWLFNMLIAGMALGVALGLAELVVRWLAPQQLFIARPDIWQAVDSLGWVNRPGLNTTINTGERTIRLLTDRDGFRVGQAGRVAGKKRILLLGDSFMEALQVDYEQSFAGLLEARLAQRFKYAVAVRNTGVSGWDPPQYLIQARHTLDRDRPDLVVVAVYLGNDVVPKRVERYTPRAPTEVHRLRLPRRLSSRELIDALLYPVNDFLKARSHLFIFFKTRLNVVLTRLGLSAEEFPVDLLRKEAGSPRWSVTAQILSDIRDVARARGAPTLFVLIPATYQVDTSEFHRALKGFRVDPGAVDIDQPNRLLTTAMSVHHLDVFDVLSDFRRAAHAGTHLYGKVDLHLSPAGNDLLERVLEPVVAAHLAAPRRLAPPSVSGGP